MAPWSFLSSHGHLPRKGKRRTCAQLMLSCAALQGFLLCIPEGFLSPEELEQGQQATAAEGIGPSLSPEAPPLANGDWRRRGGRGGLGKSSRGGPCSFQSPSGMAVSTFSRWQQRWCAKSGFGSTTRALSARTGQATRPLSGAEAPSKAKAKAKAKRPSVQPLAS